MSKKIGIVVFKVEVRHRIIAVLFVRLPDTAVEPFPEMKVEE